MDEFSVSYDRTTKIVTAVACMLLAIPPATLHNILFRVVGVVTILVGYVSLGLSNYAL